MWNLESQRYTDVLIPLKGSKLIKNLFSVLPSSKKIVPQYKTRPLSGVLVYVFNPIL